MHVEFDKFISKLINIDIGVIGVCRLPRTIITSTQKRSNVLPGLSLVERADDVCSVTSSIPAGEENGS